MGLLSLFINRKCFFFFSFLLVPRQYSPVIQWLSSKCHTWSVLLRKTFKYLKTKTKSFYLKKKSLIVYLNLSVWNNCTMCNCVTLQTFLWKVVYLFKVFLFKWNWKKEKEKFTCDCIEDFLFYYFLFTFAHKMWNNGTLLLETSI